MGLDAANIVYNEGVQSAILVQVALTLILYIVLKIVHFMLWGYDEGKAEKHTGAEQSKQGAEQQGSKKWNQTTFNIYFPIIFAYHLMALSPALLYLPHAFTAIVAWFHFALFLGLILTNILLRKENPEQTEKSRAVVSRIIWGLMCLMNVI